jgi:copper transport protein
VLAALGLVLGLVLGTAAPAAAHAELVDTDPDQGAVLDHVPEEVALTFNEVVRQVPDGVRVYDAEGHELASTARTRDEDLLVTIKDEVAAGTLVVAWRVVSTDGHPISGSLTFSIGAPSAQTSTPPAVSAPRAVSVALSLSRWPAYVGLLLAVGLVWFVGLVVPPEIDRGTAVFRRLRTIARWAAVVSVSAWVVGLLVEAVYLRGSGFSSLAETETFGTLPQRELVAVAVVAVGLGGAVLAEVWWPRWPRWVPSSRWP